MPADHVTTRELYTSLERLHEKIDVRLGSIEDDFSNHRVEDERRFGRMERLLVGAGVVQTIVVGAVAILNPSSADAMKTAAQVVLHAFPVV